MTGFSTTHPTLGKSGFAFLLTDTGGKILLGLLLAAVIIVPILNLLVPPSSPFHVSTFMVSLFGKYLCYALLALSVDLIWGFCGILSLGHGAFFALGGYAMGMYMSARSERAACMRTPCCRTSWCS